MTKDEALKMAIDTLQKAKRKHFYCEDTYYSCPKHEDGCADDRQPDECNCGADKLNAEIDMSINACKEALDTEQVREDLPAQEPQYLYVWFEPNYGKSYLTANISVHGIPAGYEYLGKIKLEVDDD
jgi:hypothetical protein